MACILIILFLSFPETWEVIVDEVLQGGELVVAQVKACQFVCSNDVQLESPEVLVPECQCSWPGDIVTVPGDTPQQSVQEPNFPLLSV